MTFLPLFFKPSRSGGRRGFAAAHPASRVDFQKFWCKIFESGSNPTKEMCHMSLEIPIAELERRHRDLEDEISEALTHPSSDGLKIAELKRLKLQVKDEIARLQQDTSVSVH
jgi:hypothetical protein